MKEKLKNNIPLLLVLLFTLLFANLHINKRTNHGKDVCFSICGDARGYYAWLPAIFIYHDLNFNFFDQVEMKDTTCGCVRDIPIQDYRYTFDGKACNKYYPGASLMLMPFFFIAHLATICFTDLAPNGYTFLYFRLMPLAAFFYYFLGMLFLLRILDKLKLNSRRSKSLII